MILVHFLLEKKKNGGGDKLFLIPACLFLMSVCVTVAMWETNKEQQNHMDQPLKTTHTPNMLMLTQPFASLWEKAADQFF